MRTGIQSAQVCNRLADGTYSWTQPPSTGFQGWEGYCGQTCVANILTTCTPNRVSPERVMRTAGDWTPGSKPSTLLAALHFLSFSTTKSWGRTPSRGDIPRPHRQPMRRDAYPSRRTFSIRYNRGTLAVATRSTPIACLLQWSASTLHWVMVVRATGDRVWFNHWGDQDSLSRSGFDRLWGFHTQTWGDRFVSFFGQLSPYTSLR